jgi:hypothetical protein
MKNFIILILLLAVGVLAYLHFFNGDNPLPSPPTNTKTIELGKDSIKLSFYVDERLDSTNIDNPPEGETKKTKQAASLTLATTPCIGEPGKDCPDLFSVVCCHLPPPNVIPTYGQRFNIFDKNIVKGLRFEVVRGK